MLCASAACCKCQRVLGRTCPFLPPFKPILTQLVSPNEKLGLSLHLASILCPPSPRRPCKTAERWLKINPRTSPPSLCQSGPRAGGDRGSAAALQSLMAPGHCYGASQFTSEWLLRAVDIKSLEFLHLGPGNRKFLVTPAADMQGNFLPV